MKSYNIAVIPGDGVGKEVTDEGLKVLNTLAEKHSFDIRAERFRWGCDYYMEQGKMMQPNQLSWMR